MGESDWGYLELGPGTPAMGTGFHIQDEKFFRTQIKIHTQRPQYAKKI